MLRRVRSWETVNGASTDLDRIALDSKYGADKENSRTLVPFYDGGKPCEVERAIDATVAEKGSYHIVAVELDCSTGSRIGLAVTLADGALLQSFGSGGSKVLAGPGVVDAIPVGVETQAPTRGLTPAVTKSRWVWLGAAVGPECNPVGDACSFGLTRIDYVTGALHTAGWFTPAEQSFWDSARPRDMALDTKGRPVMAGVVELERQSLRRSTSLPRPTGSPTPRSRLAAGRCSRSTATRAMRTQCARAEMARSRSRC